MDSLQTLVLDKSSQLMLVLMGLTNDVNDMVGVQKQLNVALKHCYHENGKIRNAQGEMPCFQDVLRIGKR